VDEEIDAHLELRTRDLMAAGMTLKEARAEALRRFGDLGRSRRMLRKGARRRESVRKRRDRLGALAGDARFAWRQMRRAPVFSAIQIATLAIGIGLTTAMFALVDHVLLRPLPFAEPERLVSLSSVDSTGNDFPIVSSSNWQDWHAQSRALEVTAIHMERGVDLHTDQGAIRTTGQLVSGAFFEVIRPRFIVGRPFTAPEVDAGSTDVVVSEGLWRSRLGADPTLATALRTVTGDRRVVGVVADGHIYPAGTDVWHPTTVPPARNGTRNNINWRAVARLRPSVSPAQAERELAAVAAGIRQSDPSALYSYGVGVRSLKEQIIGRANDYLRLLLGAVAFVLLIACANVAAANLARGTLRAREIAIRAAIGAGRGRLIQQLLVEHMLLALAAALLGVFLAWIALRAAITAWGARVPRALDVELSPPVLALALGVTMAASVLSGLLPALAGSRLSLSALLARVGRGTTRGRQALAGRALVAAQIGIAVMLTCASALTMRSFQELIARDLGFAVNVATVEAALVAPGFRADSSRQFAYWEALRESLGAIPGVDTLGLANWTPLGSGGASFIEVEGSDVPNPGAGFRVVSDGYLEALAVPLIAGRTISERDVAGSMPVTVINRAMAQRFWPGQIALGKRIRATSMEDLGRGRAPWRTVVGIVGDVRNDGFGGDIREEMYVPHRQAPYWIVGMTAVVRGTVPVERLLPEIRARARAVDASVAVEVGTMSRRVTERIAPQRMIMTLLGLFSGVSLLLAAMGTYGLLSYLVATRTRELAVRAALGATSMKLIALVVSGASVLIAAGVALGVGGALALTRTLESQLVEVSKTDPLAFATGVVVIGVTALLAALIPAIRASAPDPARALRTD
jgi:predicted permease